MEIEETNFESMTEEELLKKHRQERKDLQSKIQSLKRLATKGDKKKKKEVAETVAQLEKELDDKQEAELQNASGANNATGDSPEDDTTDAEVQETTIRISRAQRRRNKKQTADKEREKRIADQEENNKHGPRTVELNTIKEILQSEGLQIHNIPADGNCLYCAVNHQLAVTGRTTLNVTKLRKLTATFMHDNKEDFLPFMCNDNDGMINEEQFDKYCKDVATTKLWGGQLEITALSKALKCPIKVIQASGPLAVQGENYEGPPLVLTYHKHLFRLGEHYNSTVTLGETEDSEVIA